MQVKPDQYNWSEFISRMKAAGYGSLAAWCRRHGVAYKTVWALIHGSYNDGIGPKIQAIIDQAMQEGLIAEIKKAA